jgi:hypothetical protein
MDREGTTQGQAAGLPKNRREGRLQKDTRYRRLKVGGRTATGRSSYWVGEDHLLVVQTEHFAESYKRFFFVDIRAVLIRRTRAWEWGLVLGLAGWGFLALIALSQMNQLSGPGGATALPLMVVFGTLALLVMAAVIVHGLKGPSCVVSMHTGVQSRQLTGLRRWRQAERFVTLLEPVVLAAQRPVPGDPSEAVSASVPPAKEPTSGLAEDRR